MSSSSAWINGAGTLAIDRVEGLMFELSVQGSGGWPSAMPTSIS